MVKNKEKKMKEKTGVSGELVLLLPILFLVTVFLFCVRARIAPSYLTEFFWFEGGEYVGDLYAYFRAQLFLAVTAISMLYLIFCCVTGKVKLMKHKVYIPMAVYGLLVVVSYALSDYKNIALMGTEGRYEGTLVLLSYMLMLFYGMHAVKSDKGVKLIVKCFAVACLVLGIWGIMQLCGMGLDSLPANLIIPASVAEMGSLNLKHDTGAINWFFSNQNYTSFFMIFPICIFAMSCIAEEDMKKKVMYAALTGLMMFSLWQAASLGGMVAIAVAVVVALLIAGSENIMKWKKSLGLLFLAGVLSVGASLPVIMREVESGSMAGNLLGLRTVFADEVKEEQPLRFERIEDIITDGAAVTFVFESETITVTTENNEIKSVLTADGKAVAEENGLMRASTVLHEETGVTLLNVETANRTWNFGIVEDAVWFVTPKGNLIPLSEVERMGFEGNEEFATNRGYIWSRTLPLLKDTILFGHGADTYEIYFPQDDYEGRYNISYFDNSQNVLIDKPHNMYLGTAVNTGVISMLALVAVYVFYLIESVKTYRKHEFTEFKDYAGMGICIAIAGFMVSGLVNDSTVQMMPVVYALMGVGFAVNKMVKKSKEC